MTNAWKRMSSGKYLDLNCLLPEDILLSDIETSLNNQVRFGGHWKDMPPLTVAQHSYLCLEMARMFEPDDYELHREVFMHDFEECYVGDIVTPVKRMLGSEWSKFLDPIKRAVRHSLFEEELIDPEMEIHVKAYDIASLDIERRVMWSSTYGKDKWPACPLNVGTYQDKLDLFNSVPEYISIEEVWGELK